MVLSNVVMPAARMAATTKPRPPVGKQFCHIISIWIQLHIHDPHLQHDGHDGLRVQYVVGVQQCVSDGHQRQACTKRPSQPKQHHRQRRLSVQSMRCGSVFVLNAVSVNMSDKNVPGRRLIGHHAAPAPSAAHPNWGLPCVPSQIHTNINAVTHVPPREPMVDLSANMEMDNA